MWGERHCTGTIVLLLCWCNAGTSTTLVLCWAGGGGSGTVQEVYSCNVTRCSQCVGAGPALALSHSAAPLLYWLTCPIRLHIKEPPSPEQPRPTRPTYANSQHTRHRLADVGAWNGMASAPQGEPTEHPETHGTVGSKSRGWLLPKWCQKARRWTRCTQQNGAPPRNAPSTRSGHATGPRARGTYTHTHTLCEAQGFPDGKRLRVRMLATHPVRMRNTHDLKGTMRYAGTTGCMGDHLAPPLARTGSSTEPARLSPSQRVEDEVHVLQPQHEGGLGHAVRQKICATIGIPANLAHHHSIRLNGSLDPRLLRAQILNSPRSCPGQHPVARAGIHAYLQRGGKSPCTVLPARVHPICLDCRIQLGLPGGRCNIGLEHAPVADETPLQLNPTFAVRSGRISISNPTAVRPHSDPAGFPLCREPKGPSRILL